MRALITHRLSKPRGHRQKNVFCVLYRFFKNSKIAQEKGVVEDDSYKAFDSRVELLLDEHDLDLGDPIVHQTPPVKNP